MDTPNQIPSLTEKHNAMISYCFLAPFMLLSSREEFKNNFVRSHSRYAAMIHVAFLILVICLIRSRNFSSIIIYDLTWVHTILFVLFFSLLFFLGNGLYSALNGQKPRINFNTFSMKGFEKEFSTEIKVTEEEKTGIILSHIPFLGIYLSAKYGGKISVGEKFSNWLSIILLLAIVIDPSLTLFIVIIILTIFWLVYQTIGTVSNTVVHLLGERFWDGRSIHVYTKSVIQYVYETIKHSEKMPSFKKIYDNNGVKYENMKQEKCSPIIFVPFINIISLFRLRKDENIRVSVVQGGILSLLGLYSILSGDIISGTIALLAGFWSYNQSHFNKSTYIPIIGECADIIIKIMEWKKNKSTPTEIRFTTHL